MKLVPLTKNRPATRPGFTLVEIMIVVSLIGMLAAISIPSFIKARSTSQTKACINNLRQIDSAKQQWALENHQPGGALPVETDIGPYLNRNGAVDKVVCPADPTANFTNSYSIHAVTNQPACIIDSTSHTLAN